MTLAKCFPSLEEQINSEVCLSCLCTVHNIASFQFGMFDNTKPSDLHSWKNGIPWVCCSGKWKWRMHLATEEKLPLSAKNTTSRFPEHRRNRATGDGYFNTTSNVLPAITEHTEHSLCCNTMCGFSGCLWLIACCLMLHCRLLDFLPYRPLSKHN